MGEIGISGEISVDSVRRVFDRHTSIYRYRSPVYQTVILREFSRIWAGHHGALLDFGGGTGLMAEAMQQLLPVGSITTIDTIDRFYRTLTVKTATYDGGTLPFSDGTFDAATITNVIHHLPVEARPRLMAEVCRVVHGPIYIKDHVATSWGDHLRLAALDAIGNVPFGGMVSADYLSMQNWHDLASACGCRIHGITRSTYRRGLQAVVFPNRLECVARFDRA